MYNLSQYLNNLMHKICFTIRYISCLYMFRAHMFIITISLVSSLTGVMIPEALKCNFDLLMMSTCARHTSLIVKQILCIKLVKY